MLARRWCVPRTHTYLPPSGSMTRWYVLGTMRYRKRVIRPTACQARSINLGVGDGYLKRDCLGQTCSPLVTALVLLILLPPVFHRLESRVEISNQSLCMSPPRGTPQQSAVSGIDWTLVASRVCLSSLELARELIEERRIEVWGGGPAQGDLVPSVRRDCSEGSLWAQPPDSERAIRGPPTPRLWRSAIRRQNPSRVECAAHPPISVRLKFLPGVT